MSEIKNSNDSDERRSQWAKTHGLTESKGRVCIKRLLGKKCDFHGCHAPGDDHVSLWLKDGKPYCYVSQPYGLSSDILREMAQFAERHGLRFTVDRWPSCHNDGVLTVVWYAGTHWE